MQRLLAILVAGTVSATSVAAAETCQNMRVLRLKRCCCPASAQGHARLTCCDAPKASGSTVTVRDRHEQPQLVATVVAARWSVVSLLPQLLSAAPRHSVAATAAGPPLLPLRI